MEVYESYEPLLVNSALRKLDPHFLKILLETEVKFDI